MYIPNHEVEQLALRNTVLFSKNKKKVGVFQEDIEVDQESSEKLRDAFMELENLKREAHEESWQRQKAERDLVEASRKVSSIGLMFIATQFQYHKNTFTHQKEQWH